MPAAADAQDRREAIADAHAVFGADLIGGHASRVGLEREDDQVEHGANIVGRSARRDVEVDRLAIDLRQSLAQPVLGPRKSGLDLAERFQEFVQPPLIGPAQVVAQRARVFQQEIDPPASRGQRLFPCGPVAVRGGFEEAFEDAARSRLGGNGPPLGIEGDRGRSALGADAAVTGKHQRGDARVGAGVAGDQLVQRDRVLQTDANVGSRQPHVDGVVTDQQPTGGMRHAAEDGHVAPVAGPAVRAVWSAHSPSPRCGETRSSPPPKSDGFLSWESRPRCRRRTHKTASAARPADRLSPSLPARARPTTARRREGMYVDRDARRDGPWWGTFQTLR